MWVSAYARDELGEVICVTRLKILGIRNFDKVWSL